jgi:hypothetical protein
MSKPIATWVVELNCYCPNCDEYVDLTSADDFWYNHKGLAIAETGTERSNNLDVVCFECNHRFAVECQY